MIRQEEYIKEINHLLSTLATYLEPLSKLNLNDGSIFAEDLFKRLLNLTYGYALCNANVEQQNATAIDLYDPKNRVAVQVTSTKRLPKIKACLKSFVGNQLDEKYDTLLIYILTSKQKKYTLTPIQKKNFSFDPNIHIIDKQNILSCLMDLDTATVKEIRDLLKEHLKCETEETKQSNEVNTII